MAYRRVNAYLTSPPDLSHTLNISAAYRRGERRPSIRVRFRGPSEAALPVSGVASVHSVTPVAAHPFGEVPIIVLIVVRHDSG